MNTTPTMPTMRRLFWNHTEACRAAWRAAERARDVAAVRRLARCTGECMDAARATDAPSGPCDP